ncbi:MAG: lipopolysaccharide biosynthesis protein [Tannerellaceae bacterium]|nr:lipopolysaccharide biosynthesis protein [Tannerellaceae bacterium]
MNKRRIARNTIALYVRTLLVMLATLYTSRIALGTLGVEDFGIYDVVGSVVTVFSFANLAMTAATQRFLNYELGRGSAEGLRRVFGTSFIIHAGISVIILIVFETGGLWFLQNRMNIPVERADAAFGAYQFAVIASVVSFASVPYHAAIIAHERMDAFAYISIFEVAGRLIAVYALTLVSSDRLATYGVLVCIAQATTRLAYIMYCRRFFPETHCMIAWEKRLFGNMLSFCGWNLFGNIAFVCLTQGTNVLLNLFFDPVVNAAKGVATQVQMAVTSFFANMQVAFNPQVVKSFVAGNTANTRNLIFLCTRISFYLALMLSLPVLFDTNVILRIWLKNNVPVYTTVFVQLSMIIAIFQSMGSPLIMGNAATGEVKKLMTTVGLLFWTVIPLSYIGLKLGGSPPTVFWVQIVLMIVAHIIRIRIVGKQLGFSVADYCKCALNRMALVSIVCLTPLYVLHLSMAEGMLRLLTCAILSVATVGFASFFLGLTGEERMMVKNFVIQKIKR